MKKVLILGAGSAGTVVANRLRRSLPADWSCSVVDPARDHLYQPDLLFIPFGKQDPARASRPRSGTLHSDIEWIREGVEVVDPERKQVRLESGTVLPYDLLVLASGSQVRPEETEGLLGEHYHRSVHDFYTLDGAVALRDAMSGFEGGRFVLNLVEMPIKCPVAPLEFLFLADEYFTVRGIRDQVDLVYVTPLDGAFTRPLASDLLGSMLDDKGIRVEAEFATGSVDAERRVVCSWDEREIAYDMLVSIPTHMGAPFVEASGLGDELGFVPTDHHTLISKQHDSIFVLGDATNLPSSKAGSVAHFQSEVVVENLLRKIRGKSPAPDFDGHSNCFIESGFGKALLIDFNYEVEPLPGMFPIPIAGPLSLMKESRRNHWGKLAFRWLYWNALLPARPLPVTTQMSMAGKHLVAAAAN
jgi:sulfide:quinone oxidoreductase